MDARVSMSRHKLDDRHRRQAAHSVFRLTLAEVEFRSVGPPFALAGDLGLVA
jgi:hypothetical protein